MIWIALKNLMNSGGRSILTIIGMAIGVGAIISLVGIADGIRSEFTGMLTDMQGIYVMQDGVMNDAVSRVNRKYIDEIREISGVENAYGEISAFADSVEGVSTMGGGGGLSSFVGIMGVDAEYSEEAMESIGYTLDRGRYLNSNDGKVIIIGNVVADAYNKNIGMTLKIGEDKFKIVGIASANMEMMGLVVVMPLDEALEYGTVKDDEVSIIMVTLKENADPDAVADRINFRFEGEIEASSASDYSDELGGILDMITNFFWAVSGLAALIGGIGIINTMLMSVMERTNEFGLLSAVGWTRGNILKLVMFEAMWIGVLGGIVGIAVGMGGLSLINSVIDWGATLSIELSILAFSFSSVLALLAGIYPAYTATKVDPIEALRFG